MVVDCFDGRACEEPHTLTGSHKGKFVSNAGSKRIKEEAFKRMVIQGAKGVRNVEAVMARMEGCYIQLDPLEPQQKLNSL